jgi:hypothetical protein
MTPEAEAVGAPEPLLLIVDPEGEQPAEWCSGPDEFGQCPRAAEGEYVPCAGKQLVPVHGDLSPTQMRMVCAREDECPLRILLAGGG